MTNKLLPKKHLASTNFIIGTICEAWGISPRDIKGHRRKEPIPFARHVAMHFCYAYTNLTLEEIGDLFDGHDHSSVCYARKRVKQECENDKKIAVLVRDLEKRIKNHEPKP